MYDLLLCPGICGPRLKPTAANCTMIYRGPEPLLARAHSLGDWEAYPGNEAGSSDPGGFGNFFNTTKHINQFNRLSLSA
jgi:hypothetical protein